MLALTRRFFTPYNYRYAVQKTYVSGGFFDPKAIYGDEITENRVFHPVDKPAFGRISRWTQPQTG